MPVEFKNGKLEIFRRVRGYLIDQGVTANVVFGWKQRARQDNAGPGTANRVVFTPSDDSGRDGRYVPVGGTSTVGPGYRPFGADGKPFHALRSAISTEPVPPKAAYSARPLVGVESLMTVSIWGCDPTGKEDEELQYEVTCGLERMVIQAIYHSGLKDIEFADRTWTVTPQNQYGRELRFTINIKEVIYENASGVLFPGAEIEGLDDE